LDEAGIPTVSITQVPGITRLIKPSLACFVAHPFGLTLGAVGDAATHRAVVEAVLAEAYRPHPPGTIVPMPFRWPDDLRQRQLGKEVHGGVTSKSPYSPAGWGQTGRLSMSARLRTASRLGIITSRLSSTLLDFAD